MPRAFHRELASLAAALFALFSFSASVRESHSSVNFIEQNLNEPRPSRQFAAGTILITVISENEIVLAADSRITLRAKNGAVTHSDRECKLGVLAPLLIYASAGKRTVPALIATDVAWDSHQTAEQAVQSVLSRDAPPESHTVMAVAKQWEALTFQFFTRRISVGQKVLLDAGNAEAVFAGRDPDGRISVVRTQVRITPTRSTGMKSGASASSARRDSAASGARGNFAFFSTTDALLPCRNGAARFWEDGEGKEIARAYLEPSVCKPTTASGPGLESAALAAVQHTIDQRIKALGSDRAEVAPPIAAIAFDRNGWRWIQPGACRQ